MFSFEPPRTAYDLRFQIAGIPVRVHPLFWLATLLLGSNSWRGDGAVDPDAGMKLLIWAGVMFVSILVHELGHSGVMRYFGQSPRIVLHMLGGLAIADADFMYRRAARRTPQQQILISLAGPGAGFLLATLTAVLVTALGGEFRLDFTDPPFFYNYGLPDSTPRPLQIMIAYSLFFNIFWGLVNLLPVLPLDGGQAARELLEMNDTRHGFVRSLQLSIIAAIVVAVAGWMYLDDWFMAFLFASLAASNYMTLQQITGGGTGGRPW
ncbi:MAG: site-2 protease family protein [Pirellulaceae bacterium]